jgi:hypothetical protein
MSIDTRIRDLSEKAVAAKDEELDQALNDLRAALREHIRHVASTYHILRDTAPSSSVDRSTSQSPSDKKSIA